MLSPAWLARAQSEQIELLPTVVRGESGELARPDETTPPTAAEHARVIDDTLGEAAQDLGLSLDVGDGPPPEPDDDDALIARASEGWVVSTRIEVRRSGVRVRMVAVAPGSNVLLTRSLLVAPDELELRTMVTLRDLIQAGRREPAEPAGAAPVPCEKAAATRARSEGGAVLALSSALFGGYIGFTLQSSGGSDDSRLTYPLVTLGTGIGLGAAMIAADEWDVGTGDAWFVLAATVWPGAGGFLLAQSYDARDDDRFLYGLAGSSAGLTLATATLTQARVSEGSAVLTHSGGFFGLALGGMTQLFIEGDAEASAERGAGYGTIVGTLGAGVVATQVDVSSSRMLLVDLGAALGGLTGAAVASPLVFADERTETKDRIWLASIGAGAVAGGLVALSITDPHANQRGATHIAPYAGPIGITSPGGASALAYGGGVHGIW